jgi:hypothetical protein
MPTLKVASFYRVQWIDAKGKSSYIGEGRNGGYIRGVELRRSKWSRSNALWLKQEAEALGFQCVLTPIGSK